MEFELLAQESLSNIYVPEYHAILHGNGQMELALRSVEELLCITHVFLMRTIALTEAFMKLYM